MLNKILYMTSYKMQAEESMRRIDMILTAKTQEETNQPKHPKSYDVVFEDVTFPTKRLNSQRFQILALLLKRVQQQHWLDTPAPVRALLPV